MAVKLIPNDIFQYSLKSAFNAGLNDGGPPVALLKNHGNHGIGLFEVGDADIMQIDGETHSVDKNGAAELTNKGEQLSFVMVTIFQPKECVELPIGTTNKKL